MRNRLFSTLFIILISVGIYSQDASDTIAADRILTIAPFSLLDKTISVSYYQEIGPDRYLTFNPRFRARLFDPLFIAWDNLLNYDNHFNYSRALLRHGLQFRKKSLFFEPLVQEDFGWSGDRWISLMDDERSYLVHMRYFSLGMIALVGWYREEANRYRRVYLGAGIHHSIRRHIYTDYVNENMPEDVPEQPYRKVINNDRNMPSFHLGIEYGFLL